jgi:porin
VVLTGLLPAHLDQLGLALGIVQAGRPFRTAQLAQGQTSTHSEYITELTYYLPVTGWLSLQPDIQHVHQVGFSSELHDAWLFGLRFELTMSKSE